MSRKLVLCLDGTSNRFRRDNTNVVKFVALLDRNAADQFVYYQPGIGTIAPPSLYSRSLRWIATRLDLAFAILLKYHVQDAYRYLMRHHEHGDRIYLVGFSRGAYTARVLAGMLYKVGLLERGNEELVPFAWDIYRKPGDDLARGFRNTFARKVGIEFVGVWDTVSSVRWGWRDVHLPHTRTNPRVRRFRHAVALDERRAYFRQNLWNPTPGQDVREVWFPGVHCDVGGGYREAEAGLSKIALAWMVEQAQAAELTFHSRAVDAMLRGADARFAAPDPLAEMHESLRGAWHLVEWIPKRIKDPGKSFAPRWIVPRGARRWVADGARIHASVLVRRVGSGVDYRPGNLPARHEVERVREESAVPE